MTYNYQLQNTNYDPLTQTVTLTWTWAALDNSVSGTFTGTEMQLQIYLSNKS